jgi:patatin-like phospholipase/acyl hydrolase
VLSIEGGGAKNIISLMVMDYMETYACQYATLKKLKSIECHNDRILLKDMFNMIAGSSTGGVIAAAIVSPANGTLNGSYSAI